MVAGRKLICALAVVALAAGGCGGDDSSDGPEESADKPARPDPGWRTVRNAEAGFTISVPRRWSAGVERGATLIRSPDELVVITLAADRSQSARDLEPETYARRTLAALPGFEGSVDESPPVRPSPYRNARVDGVGSVETSRRPQRLTVVAFTRPGRVTYAAVIFRNPRVDPRFHESRLLRILSSFRAQPGSG